MPSSTDSMGGSIVLPQSLNNYPQQAYVSELLSFSLDRLHKEPELLRVDAERIRRQMQEVAVGHYRAFITAADSLCSIRQEMTSVDKHLESLIGEIPKLIMGCNEFSVSGQQILDKRKLNQVLLANHSTILDLLEVPQLMDTCVRNGNFDEALDLEAFVTKLATVHSKLPIVQSLATEVKQITQSMLSQLLQRLQSNIQLPDCLMVIGYLRRLGVFTEHVLRRQFLKCRDVWLSSIIDDLDQGNTFEYLKRMADCHRMHLYDIVTQYLAIFTDDSPGDGEGYDGGLLYSWAMHRISSYLTVLSALLPKITEGVTLAILLEQCMYSGMTLGRVGLDFRGLLPPLFETAVMTLFAQNMAATVENFQLALESHRWVALPTVGIIGRGGSQDAHDNLAPPYSLMEYPPLAAFVNGVLGALNELRHCAPENLQKVLALELQHALQSVSESLLRYNATRMLRENESNLFLGMCRAFIEVACNYCITCFNRCYPASKMFHSKDYLENLRRLVFTASFPVQQQQQKEEEKETSESSEVDRNGGSIDVDNNNNMRDTNKNLTSGDAENGNNGPVNESPTTSSIHEDNVGTTIISQQTQADEQH